MRDAVRVALLARPGAGADRLREALHAAGADLVLDADPTTLEPDTLAGAGAESVVVVLDSTVEGALDRLDAVLRDPAIDVLYEEAEVAVAREGWDVARWTRHLSAKLLRHGDVLPPGRETDAAPAEIPAGAPVASMFDPVSAEYDPAEGGVDAEPVAAVVPGEEGVVHFETVEFEKVDTDPIVAGPLAFEPGEFGSFELDPKPVDAAGMPSAEPPPAPVESPLTLAPEGAPPESPHPGAGPPTPPSQPPAPEQRSEALRDFRRDLASIEQRIASMGLVDADPPAAGTAPAGEVLPGPAIQDMAAEPPAPPAGSTASPAVPAPAGAVLVFAGIGGPDAVRQFLGALPAGFPRPVLIHQRLDGGRHDRLVQQMARATTLPVQLAAEGEAVAAGHVYILPSGLGLGDGATGLTFVASGDPMSTLPPGGSAVLMFSGSDTALVDAAMGHAQAGALVAGQSPEDCYDAAAAEALVARGAESGQPADLARRLAERWAA
ncbi:MAG TPA: chemotaxis protein CheB [Xanthomonadaceae bacterium]|nr:chemotaxis protein CheB [Xanthomonadaceae bacterium]